MKKIISAILCVVVVLTAMGFLSVFSFASTTPAFEPHSDSIFAFVSATVTEKDILTTGGGRTSAESLPTLFYKNDDFAGSVTVSKEQYALIAVGDDITLTYPVDQYYTSSMRVYYPIDSCYVLDVFRDENNKPYALVFNHGEELTVRIGEGLNSIWKLAPGTKVTLHGTGDKTYIEGWSVAGQTTEMILILGFVGIVSFTVIAICVTHIVEDIKDEIELRREQKHKKTASAYRGW